jgi:hypothetical protein
MHDHFARGARLALHSLDRLLADWATSAEYLDFAFLGQVVAVVPMLSFASALMPTPVPKATRLVVKIDGWSEHDQGNAAEEVWIKADRKFRTAWR